MSFSELKESIDYGDTVLLHIGYDNMLPIIVVKGKTYQTKFGAIKHDDMVGRQYGTRFHCPKGWIHLIHPTPELWTQSLPHRTQILYSTDISMVIFQLDLKPGSIVVEAGTGSGSLSHSILRTIQPTGHLHTFEFHEERSKKARQEFQEHGLSPFVTVTHRDVCEDGFQLENIADAVFLDLPRPWDCIKSAKSALKKEGGRICSFSPCIEQVQRSCEKLTDEGFQDIITLECLNRKYNIQYAKLQNIKFMDNDDGDPSGKEVASSDDTVQPSQSTKTLDSESPSKVRKLSEQSTVKRNLKEGGKDEKKSERNEQKSLCFPSAVPASAMAGHTGFLTFASLLNKDDC